MSLVLPYDDLCRYTSVLLNSGEKQLLEFAKNQGRCQQKWAAAENECTRLQSQLQQEKAEKKTLEVQLKHVRSTALEQKRIQKIILKEKEALENKLQQAKNILCSDINLDSDSQARLLTFLNSQPTLRTRTSEGPRRELGLDSTASILTASELSYDDRDDENMSHNLRSGRTARVMKRSGTALNLPPSGRPRKRVSGLGFESTNTVTDTPRISDNDHCLVATTTVTISRDGPATATSTIHTGLSPKQKCQGIDEPDNRNQPGDDAAKSTSSPDSEDSFWAKKPAPVKRQLTVRESANMESPVNSNVRSFFTGVNLIRQHDLVQKTVLGTENCAVCNKRIRFASLSLRCRECRIACHPDCKEQLPKNCMPVINTPSKKKSAYVLADYTPAKSPMIPSLVVQCVCEIESRGLSEVGIYRIPGSEKEVRLLKDLFARGKCPNLKNVDIHVVCGCLKDFFRSLSEPLLTYSHWSDFSKAADFADRQDCYAAMYQAIMDIPKPNRETLAFMINHLKRVAVCSECRMPPANLAKVFGPTLVGHSSADLSGTSLLRETKKQQIVLEKMMEIPNDFWCNFLNPASSPMKTTPHQTKSTISRTLSEISRVGVLNTPKFQHKSRFFPTPTLQ